MIQVLNRAVQILHYLSRQGPCGLREIAAHIHIQQSTAANILKSLSELGCIRKTGEGYAPGPALLDLAAPLLKEESIAFTAREIIRKLTETVQENAIVSVRQGCGKCTIAESAVERDITVNADLFRKESLTGTATGKVLMAYADTNILNRIIREKGLPVDSWEGIGSKKELLAHFDQIRSQGIAYRSTEKGDVQALAVPVFTRENTVCASIGIYLPSIRFKGAHKKNLIRELKKAGQEMSVQLQTYFN